MWSNAMQEMSKLFSNSLLRTNLGEKESFKSFLKQTDCFWSPHGQQLHAGNLGTGNQDLGHAGLRGSLPKVDQQLDAACLGSGWLGRDIKLATDP